MRHFTNGAFKTLIAVSALIYFLMLPIYAKSIAADIPRNTAGLTLNLPADAGGLTPDLPADEADVTGDPRLMLTKIMTVSGLEIKNTTVSPLVLDKEGYSYGPLDANLPLKIKNDVLITSDNITFSGAVIDGDLYIRANNITINGLIINGTIFLDPGTDGVWNMANVAADVVSVLSGEQNVQYQNLDEQESGDMKAFLEIIHIGDFDDMLIVVNKFRRLPDLWKPDDLVAVEVPYRGRAEAKYMRKEAAESLEKLFIKAKEDNIDLCAISGFRSFSLQKTVHAKYVSQLGSAAASAISATAGNSEHQTGLAMDVSSKSMGYALSKSFGGTKEGEWLSENAARYGFIIRYPKGKEAVTGYAYEPWHIRYVGVETAVEIMDRGITLEEYLDVLPVSHIFSLTEEET